MFWKFYWAFRDVGETPRIIGKMTNVWRLVFLSIIWLLATLCNTLITFRENHWLLRLIWRFSESVSEYESVFRTCVWIMIHQNNKCLITVMFYSRILSFSPNSFESQYRKSQYLLFDVSAFREKRKAGASGVCTFLSLTANSMSSVRIYYNKVVIPFPRNPELEVSELTALFKMKELGIQIKFL